MCIMRNLNLISLNNFVSARVAYNGEYGICFYNSICVIVYTCMCVCGVVEISGMLIIVTMCNVCELILSKPPNITIDCCVVVLCFSVKRQHRY